jgi:hypothetical protein
LSFGWQAMDGREAFMRRIGQALRTKHKAPATITLVLPHAAQACRRCAFGSHVLACISMRRTEQPRKTRNVRNRDPSFTCMSALMEHSVYPESGKQQALPCGRSACSCGISLAPVRPAKGHLAGSGGHVHFQTSFRTGKWFL